MYSLAQAAKATGKSKPTIARAIKAGRLSATRGEGGNYLIDESELARVYPLAGDGTGTMKQLVPPNGAGTSPATLPGEVEGLRLLLAEREGTIRDPARQARRRDRREAARSGGATAAAGLARRPAGSPVVAEVVSVNRERRVGSLSLFPQPSPRHPRRAARAIARADPAGGKTHQTARDMRLTPASQVPPYHSTG
jgi:excisionase family DNA binding protein